MLLPPSEGKTAPQAGPPLDLAALSLPRLARARRTVLTALTRLCRAHPEHAREVLGLGAGQAAEVHRDAHLRDAPTAPAWQVYTGVLHAALDVAGASPATRQRLAEQVLVWSGLWGAIGLADPIPAYRLSGSVTLPGPGRLATFWRDPLARALADLPGPILDLRSGTYAATWTGPAERTLVGRVVVEQGGRRTVASHANKATKGRLVRALGDSGAEPDSLDALVDAIRAVGFRAEPADPPSRAGRRPGILDIVVAAP